MCESCANAYHLSNMKWGTGEYQTPGGDVYWSFATSPGDGFVFSDYITEPAYRGLIRAAFQAWEDIANITFIEVADGAQTQLSLGWDDIDGAYGVVGEARTSGTRSTDSLFSMREVEIRFDISENWATDTAGTSNVGFYEVGFYQVALHEIGHAIGLNHSDNPGTIMHASNISRIPDLTASDIASGQAIYGVPGSTAPPPAPTPDPIPDPDQSSDIIMARAGNEVIDGGAGIDTLSLSGERSDYTLTLSATGSIILTDRVGRDGSDTLISIERLDFQSSSQDSTDSALDLDALDGVTSLAEQDFAQIAELYIAYFNRAPDAVGLAFWGNAFADGVTLSDMAALFIDQDETRDTYPDALSNAGFASAVYTNVLGRVPDADGAAFWVDLLNRGVVERDTFILSVLEGAKAELPVGAAQDFVDQVMADRQYLSDKTDLGTYFAVHKGMSDVADATDAMALFDGTTGSMQSAINAIDSHYAEAQDANNGDFLLPLLGVLEDPFSA